MTCAPQRPAAVWLPAVRQQPFADARRSFGLCVWAGRRSQLACTCQTKPTHKTQRTRVHVRRLFLWQNSMAPARTCPQRQTAQITSGSSAQGRQDRRQAPASPPHHSSNSVNKLLCDFDSNTWQQGVALPSTCRTFLCPTGLTKAISHQHIGTHIFPLDPTLALEDDDLDWAANRVVDMEQHIVTWLHEQFSLWTSLQTRLEPLTEQAKPMMAAHVRGSSSSEAVVAWQLLVWALGWPDSLPSGGPRARNEIRRPHPSVVDFCASW